MITIIIDRLRGGWVLAALAFMGLYGALVIAVAPFWGRLAAAQGGADIQTRFYYRAPELRDAVAAIERAEAEADAFIFYALDAPFAAAYALGFAGLIAFGLRRLRWETSPARWLVGLPLFSGFADLMEDATLAAALSGGPVAINLVGDAAGVFTAAKFATLILSQALAAILSVAGLVAWLRARR